jgi:hypothetical protein
MSMFRCYKQDIYECECEVKKCFFCFTYTETINVYSSYECEEHENELSEDVNSLGSVTCYLTKIN